MKENEPFKKLKNVGLILAPDRQKMSKSRGNVINPDDVINAYGADALRMYEMFIGPFDQPAIWSKNGIVGTHKFLEKIHRSFEPKTNQDKNVDESISLLIDQITLKIEKNYFNTAISDFMKFSNKVDMSEMNKDQWKTFIILLSPFAPHLSEFLYSKISEGESVFHEKWPELNHFSGGKTNMIVQINGKKKATVEIPTDLEKNEILGRINKVEMIQKLLKGQKVKKTVFVEGRLVNFVI